MSLYGALFSGVSGLRSQSTKLGIISDNIANVNTVGYKSGSAIFQSLVTGAANSTSFSPGGVLGGNHQQISKQGLLQSTDSPTDISISGDGFFVVNQTSDSTGQILYTRAGSFTQDSTGNFKNSAGFFLQAWPLDPEGRLPGEPGNVTNTISSANLTSLRTVNVQSLTAGAAAATSRIALGANLNAAQVAFAGAAGDAVLDSADTNNFGIKASDIIIPSATDGIVKDTDKITISTSGSQSYDYTYGGFTFGRVVTSGAVGENGAALSTPITIGAQNTQFTAGSSVVHINHAPPAGLINGQAVTLAGDLTALNGLAAGTLNDTFIASNIVAGTSFDITLPSSVTAPATHLIGATNITANQGDTFITVNNTPPTGLSIGDVVTISASDDIVDGSSAVAVAAASINDIPMVVAAVNGGNYTLTLPAAGTVGGTGASSGGTASTTSFVNESGTPAATASDRPFNSTGKILDASTATQPFLSLTGTSGFAAAALTFTINTDTSGTVTFTYTASAPNVANHEFNTLENLATAISSVNGLTARVVNGSLYVGGSNADDHVLFANGQKTGNAGPPVLQGIDWLRELDLKDVSGGTQRFSSLQSLSDQVNASTGLSATVNDPLAASDLAINVDDPLGTITFTDTAGSTGSLVGALGLIDIASNTHTFGQSVGPLGPSYDPTDATKNMAGGTITPQFSRPVTVYDALGTAHSLNVDFLKTATNTWAVEVVVVPSTDITNGTGGQVAFGNVVFNGDGSLRSIDSNLSSAINISWAGGASSSSITMNWGTAGQPFGTPNATVIGKTDGLSQFSGSYNVNFVNQNGSQKGTLSGVSIDGDGFIIASFNNGQTQKLYKIPLASFANPDQLQTNSGNVFAQTSDSGEANLKQAGSGGVGKINSASLEQSNVELADQLTDMIIAQRAYEANTKSIQTSSTLLDALDSIIR